MKKLVLVLCIFSALGTSAQVKYESSAVNFLKWIKVTDSIRANIVLLGTNDTAATRAYARSLASGAASLIGGYGIRISGDSIIIDSSHYRKLDSIYVVNDSVFASKINGSVSLYKMRGAVFSFNGRIGAVAPQAGDYAAFYPSLTGTYDDPTWLNHLSFSKLTLLPNTLAGHGIINGVMNAGGAMSWASDAYSNRPAPGTYGRFFLAIDSNRIYFDNGTVWTAVSSAAVAGSDSAIVTGYGLIKTISGKNRIIVVDTAALKSVFGGGGGGGGIFQIYTKAAGLIINGTDTITLDTTLVARFKDTLTLLATRTYVNSRGFLTAESDPVATAKVITNNNGYGITITGNAGQSLGSVPVWSYKIDTSVIAYKTWLTAQGYLKTESDPVALAAVITNTQGTGILITGAAGQALNATPTWVFKVDTALLATRAYVGNRGYLTTETDPVAIAKIVTLNQGSGILITGVAGQTVGNSPTYGFKADTTLLATLKALKDTATRLAGLIGSGPVQLSASTQGAIPFWRTTQSLGVSPLTNDTANTRLVSTVPFFFNGVAAADIASVISNSKSTGISYSGSSTGNFTPLSASVSTPGNTMSLTNTSTSGTGLGGMTGILLSTAYNGGDAVTNYYNSNTYHYISGLTGRFFSVNMYAIATGTGSNFAGSTLRLGADSAGNVYMPGYAGTGTRALTVGSTGILGTAGIQDTTNLSNTKVNKTTTLTIGATTQDLSTNRTFLANVVNALQLINLGGAHGLQIGTYATRTGGSFTAGDIYIVSDSNLRFSYYSGSAWSWITDKAGFKDTLYTTKGAYVVKGIGGAKDSIGVKYDSLLFNAAKLVSVAMSLVAPTDGQAMVYDNSATKYVAKDVVLNAGGAKAMQSGPFLSRPIASNSQTLYVATDSGSVFFDVGSWVAVGGSSITITRQTTAALINGVTFAPADNVYAGLLLPGDYVKLQHPIQFRNSSVTTGDSLAYSNFDTMWIKRLVDGWGMNDIASRDSIILRVDSNLVAPRHIVGDTAAVLRSLIAANSSDSGIVAQLWLTKTVIGSHRYIGADSAAMAAYFLRRADSLKSFVTPKNLSDTSSALRTLISSAGAGPANPTGTVGFSTVNGSATTFMRSDAAPKIDTSLSTGVAPRHIVGDTAAAIRTTVATKLSNTLSSGNILVGNGSNVATSVTASGDWTINSAGVTTLKGTGVGAGTCTNCNVTFDNQGRETGYSSGSNISSFWTPETFGAVADGVTDCTLAFQRAIDSAGVTKGTVLLSKGTYIVAVDYRDTANVYKPSGLHLRSNVTIDGPGSGAVIKIAASLPSSTFTPVAPPLTWTTNTVFSHLFHLDTVTGVILRNFRIDGNIVNRINRYGFDAYKNPQDGTTTQNIQTNAIDIRGGSNNTIYNVRIDSVSGYGIRDSGSKNNNYNYTTVTTTINGGVYYSFANVDGSILQNSLLTNSWCDNVRIRSSNVSVLNNEISYAKFNPNGNGGSFINFAGLYIESGTWGDVVGMNISGNYIHDNSAYGIDGNNTDTLRYTYPGQSALIANNIVSYNGAGGIQVALPFMSIKGNNIFNNAATSAGAIDSSASQCSCSIHFGSQSFGAAITGNDMRDTRKRQKSGGLNGGPIALLTFTNNTASGMSLTNSLSSAYLSTAPYNNVSGNSYIDTNNVIHSEMSIDGAGNMHLTPQNGQNGAVTGNVYFGDGTSNAGLFGNYKTSGGTFGLIAQQNSTNMMRFDLNNAATYSGSVNATSGRQIIFGDATNSLNRAGIDQNGTLFVGTTGSSYALKVSQIGTDLATVNAGVEAVATGNGSTANIVQATFKSVLNAGYTGSGYPMAAYFLNSTAGTGNSIAGASAIKGNFGFYSGSNSSTASGTNIGGFAYAASGLRCVGLVGDATLTQANSASALSIGVAGFGLRNNASAIHVGGYFGLQSAQPTFANAALIADNGATSDPVFLARVNGSIKAQINSTGNGLFNTSTDSSAYVHIGAGTTSNAPLKLTAGALLTTPKNGDIEFDGVNYYGTAGGTRTAFGGLSGTYVPTLANKGFSGTFVSDTATWVRVGNTVIVSGRLITTPTAINSSCELYISLPIASALSGGHACNGVANTTGTGTGGGASTNGMIYSAVNVSTGNAVLNYGSSATATPVPFEYTFTYIIQ